MKNLLRTIPFIIGTFTVLFCLIACSANEGDVQTPFPQNFQTTYYLEVDDGIHTEIYEGTSTSNQANRFADYPGNNLMLISYDAFENEHDGIIGITGTILLDKNRNLYPFGKILTDNQLKTNLVISVENKYIESLLTGTQKLTDIKYYPKPSKEHHGKIAFKYEFRDVPFKDRLTNKNYTVSGYIISEAADELAVNK